VNYLRNEFSDEYEPTVLDVYRGTKNVDQKQIELEIHDTSGDEHLGVNRKQQYEGCDVFAICVSAAQRSSMESIQRWKAEIQSKEPEKPICLVMTKRDLLDEAEEGDMERFVSKKELLAKKKEFGFVKFSTTSSKAWSDFNVHKAFNTIIMAGYEYKAANNE
jgi:GTPase KRas protein